MKRQIELDCSIVSDLLPLYCDDEVSDASKAAIMSHLEYCDECNEEYNKMCAEMQFNKSNNSKNSLENFFKKIRFKALLKGFLTALLILVFFFGIYYTLFNMKISKLSPDDITVEHAYKTDNGIFLIYTLPYKNGIELSTRRAENSLEVSFKEAILNLNKESEAITREELAAIDCESIRINGKDIKLQTENIPEYVTDYLSELNN